MRRTTSKAVSVTIDHIDMRHFGVFLLFALFLILFSGSLAFAQSPIGSVLCSAYGLIYHDIGRALATLGVLVFGIAATLGRVTWAQGLIVIVCIGGLFSAFDIITMLMPNTLFGSGNAAICDLTGSVANYQSAGGKVFNMLNIFR
ncbi:MAG: TrbC/VirB2 family protein [Rickettsiales bacterium]